MFLKTIPRIELLIIPCLVIALLVNIDRLEAMEILQSFSIYLEAVAILPQYHFVAKAKHIHKHVFRYLLALGIYKGLYLAHWTYLYCYFDKVFNNVWYRYNVASDIVQFLLFCGFFARVVPFLDFHGQKQHQGNLEKGDGVCEIEDGDRSRDEYPNCNISTIVLTPDTLTTNSEKVCIRRDIGVFCSRCGLQFIFGN